jgi:hypothetical protein
MGGVVTLTEMSNAKVAPTFVIVIVFVAIWATFRFTGTFWAVRCTLLVLWASFPY